MAITRIYTFCLLAFAAIVTVFVAGMGTSSPLHEIAAEANTPAENSAADQYIVLSWNDLGMHCYNKDFQDLAVLPPYNTLWAQVIRVGDPPQIVTTGITVTYAFTDNTYSAGKSNFWEYDVPLFGVDLPPNVGLTGNGLSGAMKLKTDHFVADGIPLTEFRDSAPSTRYPYQLATIIVYDANSGVELARNVTVAPVSTEMHCDNCHHDGGVEGIATGRVETNILTLHDDEEGEGGDGGSNFAIPAAALQQLMPQRPVLCAKCHASNALGTQGEPGVPNLADAMHEKHAGEVPDSKEGCYNCHPGPTTQCLRDVMSEQHGMQCVDCHGGMQQVAQNPNPWLNEPRCDNCHDQGQYEQNAALYRMSSGHGGIYCAGCHDSPHAIAPSREANDAIKFMNLQGHSGPLDTCTTCHLTTPSGEGPHGFTAPDQNVAPRFTSTPRTAATIGVAYSYAITTADGDVGDTRTISALTKPSWLVLADHGDGTATLSGTPQNVDLGKHAVLLQVRDAALATDTQAFSITVGITAPTTGNIDGVIYFDIDKDGQKDANEQGMVGVTVTLTNSLSLNASVAGAQTQMVTVTGSDGSYHFTNVAAGAYIMSATPPAGYTTGGLAPAQVTVVAGETIQAPPFGLRLLPHEWSLSTYLPQAVHQPNAHK